MIQIGDIILHTKNGNNNSYNKDDGTNYLNWQKVTIKDGLERRIMTYTVNLIKFIKQNSIFKSKEFLDKITYHYDNGEIADDKNMGYWTNHDDEFFGALINDDDKKFYIASNKGPTNLNIKLPNTLKSWHVIMDSSNFSHLDFEIKEKIDKFYILNPSSLAIFVEGD